VVGAKTSQEYRARAAEYKRLADDPTYHDFREVLLLISARWQAAADKPEAAALASMNAKASAGRWVLRR
jgi:hypothetical protein